MPTYEYVCEKCGKKFELFQRMTEDPIKVCPDKKCKGHVKRLIGEGAGIIFKGHGFYCTEYKSSSTPPAGEHHHHHSSESSSSNSGGDSSAKETKTDSGSSESKSNTKKD